MKKIPNAIISDSVCVRERDKESGSADQSCTWAHHGHDISTQGPQPEPCCSLINIHFIQFIYFGYSKLSKYKQDQDMFGDQDQWAKMIFTAGLTLLWEMSRWQLNLFQVNNNYPGHQWSQHLKSACCWQSAGNKTPHIMSTNILQSIKQQQYTHH